MIVASYNILWHYRSQLGQHNHFCFSLSGTADIHSFFQGDIILTPEQKEVIDSDIKEERETQQKGNEGEKLVEGEEEEEEEHHAQKRAIQRNLVYRWRDGIVPYELSSGLCE